MTAEVLAWAGRTNVPSTPDVVVTCEAVIAANPARVAAADVLDVAGHPGTVDPAARTPAPIPHSGIVLPISGTPMHPRP